MNRHLLVIDDEKDIREIVQLTLEHLAGWTVTATGSGEEGAHLAAEHHYDAVLLDLMMPDVDGEATARLLRGDGRSNDVPILLLSAAGAWPDWADELEVSGLLGKPFDPATLPQAVSTALHW
jgi:DNA-binding response OmpR family regulator